MEILGKAERTALGYLYWLATHYGWTFRKSLAEIKHDMGGVNLDPIRTQLNKLESMGYITVNREWIPYTYTIDSKRVLKELRLTD